MRTDSENEMNKIKDRLRCNDISLVYYYLKKEAIRRMDSNDMRYIMDKQYKLKFDGVFDPSQYFGINIDLNTPDKLLKRGISTSF